MRCLSYQRLGINCKKLDHTACFSDQGMPLLNRNLKLKSDARIGGLSRASRPFLGLTFLSLTFFFDFSLLVQRSRTSRNGLAKPRFFFFLSLGPGREGKDSFQCAFKKRLGEASLDDSGRSLCLTCSHGHLPRVRLHVIYTPFLLKEILRSI